MTRIFGRIQPATGEPRGEVLHAMSLRGGERPVRRPRLRFGMALAVGAGGGLLAGLAVILGSNHPAVTRPAATPRVAAAREVPQPRAEATAPPVGESAVPAFFAVDEPRRRPPSVAPAMAERDDKDTPDASSTCPDDGDEACGQADVLAADRALRAAYREAMAAGVDRDRLVTIRDRWARLRESAGDRPAVLVARYARMTGQLLDAAEGQDY